MIVEILHLEPGIIPNYPYEYGPKIFMTPDYKEFSGGLKGPSVALAS